MLREVARRLDAGHRPRRRGRRAAAAGQAAHPAADPGPGRDAGDRRLPAAGVAARGRAHPRRGVGVGHRDAARARADRGGRPLAVRRDPVPHHRRCSSSCSAWARWTTCPTRPAWDPTPEEAGRAARPPAARGRGARGRRRAAGPGRSPSCWRESDRSRCRSRSRLLPAPLSSQLALGRRASGGVAAGSRSPRGVARAQASTPRASPIRARNRPLARAPVKMNSNPATIRTATTRDRHRWRADADPPRSPGRPGRASSARRPSEDGQDHADRGHRTAPVVAPIAGAGQHRAQPHLHGR